MILKLPDDERLGFERARVFLKTLERAGVPPDIAVHETRSRIARAGRNPDRADQILSPARAAGVAADMTSAKGDRDA